MPIKCQKCGSRRVAEFVAKRHNGYNVMVDGKELSSSEVGKLCCGEYIEPKICLDCGQCQGSWPVYFDVCQPHKLKDVHAPNPEDCYGTIRKWEDAVIQHRCADKEIAVCDLLKSPYMGMMCIGCSKGFFIRTSDAKKTVGEMSSGFRKDFVTSDGRRKMAKFYSRKQKGEK